MTAGMQAFKDDGSVLFDTNKICYGLVKSGYLQLTPNNWKDKYVRSLNLDPGREDSWSDFYADDPIYAITVYDSISPIVFLAGDGSPCGTSVSGNTHTFYFTGAYPGTRAYVFDLMRMDNTRAGFQQFGPDGSLVFNSGQPPLNVVATVTAPPLPPRDYPNTSMRTNMYAGGSKSIEQSPVAGNPNYPKPWGYHKCYGYVPLGPGDFAACITFTRGCQFYWNWRETPPGQAGQIGPSCYFRVQEGACGVPGGVRFMFTKASMTLVQMISNSSSLYTDMLEDGVYPQALVIRTENLPFPLN